MSRISRRAFPGLQRLEANNVHERDVVRVHGDASASRIGHADVHRRTVDQAQIRMANVIGLTVGQADAKRLKRALVQMLSYVFGSNHVIASSS